MSRTRTQNFDDLALEAVEAVEQAVADADRLDAGQLLRDVEFAVEDVPADVSSYDTDVLEDRSVPLARLMPGQPGPTGRNPRVVIYRRPLELRSHNNDELAQMLRDVIVEQVANLLNVSPDDIDPAP